MDLASFRTTFEPYLFSYFDARAAKCISLANNPFIGDLLAHVRKYLTGGKRVRPYVSFLMYKSAGGQDDKAIMNVIVGLELFHLFGLIHDDIIDNGLERHHVSSVHIYGESYLRAESRRGDLSHIARAQAMLAGDLIVPWAIEVFTQTDLFTEDKMKVARQHFSAMIDQVILGQMIDADLTTQARASLQDIDQKMLLKTASYTFIQPMRIGNALAKKNKQMDSFCLHFGQAVGLAFQIQDDLLDIEPTSVSGKTPFRDVAEGQHTLLTQHIMEHGTHEQKDFLKSVWGKALSTTETETLGQIFDSSGAIAQAEQTYQKHLNNARDILAQANLLAEWQTNWSQLLDQLEARKK